VTVTLGTPALIWDDLLMTSDWLDPKEVGLLDGWSLAGWFSQNVRISGWHTAARVPRTEIPAIAAGSCFAYIKEGDETLDFLAAWAADLEQAGIGERREEGYGEVTVCNPFHVRQAVGQ
jgi:CRISPR-associated protein Csx10